MDNAFKVRTFKEVITDKNNFKEPGAVLGDFIKEGEFSVIGVAADRKSTRLNSSHKHRSRMPSSA